MSLYNILDESIAFQKKLERDTHNRLMSKKEDVILESVTEYAQNPDTYDKNIEILKSQPNVSYKNRQLIDKIAKSYRTKKKKTKSESNAFIKKEIANFDLENVGEDSFSKFRQFKLWSVENDVFEDTNVIKHLTKLAQASEEYTAKLELNTAEGEAYKARLDIGNILKNGGTVDDAKSSIDTFYNKWGDRDFGGSLTESLKEDASRMFRLNEMTKLEFVNKMNDIQNKNATKLILNQNRVNQAVMNFDKGNIGVKDGLAIYREGLYKLPDLVEKLRSDSSSTDKNRDALTALFFGNLSKGQKKIAYNALENLKNGDKLKSDEVSLLIANGKFSRANIDANNALNGNMTEQEGRKYTQRADETRLFIDELESKKDKTETDLQNIEDLKAKEQLEVAYSVLSGNSTAISLSAAEVIINGQSNIPINQTKAVKERIGKLQRARSKEREKTSAEVFRDTFGEDWREDSTSFFGLFSEDFGEIPIRVREMAVASAEEKAGYNYSSPYFKEELENAIDNIYDTHSIITGDNGGKSFIPGKLETSWVDELTDYADTFLEDEETRQGNILNNKTKEIGQSLMLLIKEGNSEAVIRDLVLSSHFSKLKSSLGTNKAAAKLGKLEQSLHITQDGYALYGLGENSITLSPNDMESIISSANQYARDIERINADSSIDSEDTEGLTRKERKDREKTRIDKVQQIKENALNKLMQSVYKHIPFLQAQPR